MMNPRVKAVVATDGYLLRMRFTNGEIGVFDCSQLLDFGVFQELREIAYFKRASVVYGTVVWPNEQDICPDTLYEESIKLTPQIAEPNAEPELYTGSCPGNLSLVCG